MNRSDKPWQTHTAAQFDVAGNYPSQHYGWLFGSLCMVAVMIATSRIDGSRAPYLFLFTCFRNNVGQDTIPCMPSTFMTYGGGEISSATVRNRQWDFTVVPLSVRYICLDFPYMVFADYTKVMGTPVWGLAWLVVSWIAFDNIDNTIPGVIDNRCWSEKCLHLWQEFIRRAVRGFIRCSLVVLQIMLPGYGIQLVLALSMMLVMQIESAFTFEEKLVLEMRRLYTTLEPGVLD